MKQLGKYARWRKAVAAIATVVTVSFMGDSTAQAFPSSYCGHSTHTATASGGRIWWVQYRGYVDEAGGSIHYHYYHHTSSAPVGGTSHYEWKQCPRH